MIEVIDIVLITSSGIREVIGRLNAGDKITFSSIEEAVKDHQGYMPALISGDKISFEFSYTEND